MMTESSFREAVALIAEVNGISTDLAAELVGHVGDTPLLHEDGRVIAIARDGTRHLIVWPTDE